MKTNTKKCLICNDGKKNDVLHHHIDPDTSNIWMWCTKCQRGYSLRQYCELANISLRDYLKQDFDFKEAAPNEVTRMEWPQHFIPLSDTRAKAGVDYLARRGLSPNGDMYYDMLDKGIVFPYYFDNIFCGAQVRFLDTKINKNGDQWKITTLPGTRLGLLVYAYNQNFIMSHVKAVIVTEGALNAQSIQQSLDTIYGGTYKNTFKVAACSGSGGSVHQLDVFKSLIEKGYKVICAPDNDEAGRKMLEKYIVSNALTHYAFTDTEADFNDELQKLGKKEFAKYFIERIKSI